MKLEILMSCMHQEDASLIWTSHITGNAVMINQCDRDGYEEVLTEKGRARLYFVKDRGLTKSRNMAIEKSDADLCMICDDDEVFLPDYEEKILSAYEKFSQADVIIFKMVNRPPSFPDTAMRLKFPKTIKVSSWQISFRRDSLLKTGVRFDELLGAGTGNGAEEELKFLRDCQKARLQIWYVPSEIASVAQEESTWFKGFTEKFFEDRGATTRYIMGAPLAGLYAVYYVIRKKSLYKENLSSWEALKAIFRGMKENRITKQAKALKKKS